MIPVQIIGPQIPGGPPQPKLIVNKDGAILTALSEPPPPSVGTDNRLRFMGGLLGSTGLDSGTTNQNVDGSATSQEFYIGANEDADVHVTFVTVLMLGGSVSLSKFGALTALTVGFDLLIRESGNVSYLINKAKTSGQVISQAGFFNPFGDGASAFIIANFEGVQDAAVAPIPISIFVPGGLRIGRGTTDKLYARINDDLTGMYALRVRVYGYLRYPD